MELTQEKLKEVLDYNPQTGVFKWKVRVAKTVHINDIAGVKNTHGYIIIQLFKKQYKAHRLAWLYVHGEWPKISDHINGIKTDNRLSNLRNSNTRHNGGNRIEHRGGKLVGFSLHKPTNKYRAQIEYLGRNFHLGLFSTAEEAEQVYKKAVEDILSNNFQHRLLK